MQVWICRMDGTSVIGVIMSIVNGILYAMVPGLRGLMKFRYNLGDWISRDGHVISFDLCEQPLGTRLSLMASASGN
jgi:hypothetical protein